MTDQIVPYQKLKQMLTTEDIKSRFHEVLGEHTSGFIVSLLNTVYMNDGLRDCEPTSIINAALNAAILHLEIDPNLGFAWIIPYNISTKRNGEWMKVKKARFQIGWKGMVQLAMRTGMYSALNTFEVYEGEQIKIDRISGRVILNGKKTSDVVIGYGAYFRLLNGFEKHSYWTVEEVRAHAERYSPSYKYDDSAWKTNFPDMAKKTVLDNLLSKYGILSIEMQRVQQSESEILREFTEASQEEQPDTAKIVDAHFETPTPEPPAAEPEDFDPIQVLIEGGSANEYAARNLLKMYVPDEAKHTKAQLVAWNNLYRAWKAQDLEAPEAASKASSGEIPQ